jgi:hypothetical protein
MNYASSLFKRESFKLCGSVDNNGRQQDRGTTATKE